MFQYTASVQEEFWASVDKSDDCWMWTGPLSVRGGYGATCIKSPTSVREPAHRVSYRIAYGDILPGSHIDHMCHTPACVNPLHLRLTTPKQNGEHRKGLNKNNTTGVRGVIWDRERNKFAAQFKHHRKNIAVGRFDTLAEAEAAVIARRAEMFTHEHSALTR